MSREIKLDSQEYLWLRLFNLPSGVSVTREYLNVISIKYDLDPDKYKNKRLLLEKILSIWEDYFEQNIEFKCEYEELHGCYIYLTRP